MTASHAAQHVGKFKSSRYSAPGCQLLLSRSMGQELWAETSQLSSRRLANERSSKQPRAELGMGKKEPQVLLYLM